MNLKQKYLSSAFLLLMSTVLVKAIGAIYKIPLTSFIGAVGRGYFSYAYNLCMPIHAITMGAFPIALSKLVSKYNFENNNAMLANLKRSSKRLFFWIGFAGMVIVIVFSSFYCNYIAKSPKAIYTVVVLAPSILFSTMSAAYRGYYEGYLNMIPTSISQSLEAIVKMVFGLAFAKLSMVYLYEQYQSAGKIFGVCVSNESEALSLIYPYTSCASMLGVALGSFVSLCFLWSYDLLKSKSIKEFKYQSANKEILNFAYPIMISTGVQSVFQFLDTASIQYALNKIEPTVIKARYFISIVQSGVKTNDYATYLYGILSTAMDFKNIVPGITMALGVSAVPAISRVWESKDKNKISSTINSILKYTIMLSSLGGLVMCFCAKDLILLFYGKSSPDIVDISADLVKWFGLTTFTYCIAGTSVFCVQAIGKAKSSIPSYAVCGALRVVLNLILLQNNNLVLKGAVVSGAVGYTALAAWNIGILCRNSSFSYDYLTNFIFAIFSFLATYFCSCHIFNIIEMPQNIVFKVMLIGFIVCTEYCILCILCGMLNFRRFFRDFNNKKVPFKT